ncbi:MAG: hypothetical protein HY940_00100 [Gammaproteobacteria bacterium]|nr:hypothetical protein [Gammaproteobacteria bacterium]
MLGRLLKGSQDTKKAAAQAPVERPVLLDNSQLVELMRCFPIGGKLRLFPELQDDVALESIVIAYGLNEHLIYTQNDIQVNIEGDRAFFVLDDNWTDITVRDVRSFCLVVPYIPTNDSALDYTSKVAMKGWNPFQRDSKLKMVSIHTERGVPHLEVVVRKRVTLKDGYYANHAVVILDVILSSLSLVDQRQHRRIKTLLPVQVSATEKGARHDSVMVDFSEYYARLEFDMTSALVEALVNTKYLYLNISLEAQKRHYRMKGRIIRRGEGHLVIEFVGMYKGSEFMVLELLDVLEFKASLLQHPETQ